MFKVKRKPANYPRLGGLPKEAWRDAGNVVAAGIVDNIMKQQQESGAPLKKNAPATTTRKRNKRRDLRSLMEKLYRFIRVADTVRGSGGALEEMQIAGRGGKISQARVDTANSWGILRYLPSGGVVVGARSQQLKNLSRWVQEKGYVGWLGISATTREALRAVLKAWVAATLKRREFQDIEKRPGK